MNIQENLKRGTIELILLTLLQDDDKYGYQLAGELLEQSHGLYELKETTMYPTLYRLQKNGYLSDKKVKVGSKRTRIYYHLTDAGKAYLSDLKENYLTITKAIQLILDQNE